MARNLVGLSMDTGHLRGAEVTLRGDTVILLRTFEEAIAEDGVTPALARLVAREKLQHSQVVTSLPAPEYELGFARFPKLAEADRVEGMRWQAERSLRLPLSESEFSFVEAETAVHSHQETAGTFVGVRKQRIRDLVGLLKNAGLVPVRIEAAPFTLLRLWRGEPGPVAAAESRALLYLDGAFTLVVLVGPGGKFHSAHQWRFSPEAGEEWQKAMGGLLLGYEYEFPHLSLRELRYSGVDPRWAENREWFEKSLEARMAVFSPELIALESSGEPVASSIALAIGLALAVREKED